MAAPKKDNLMYFPFDVTFFSDKKVRRLRAQFGSDGICVLIYLYTQIYAESYYLEYDADLLLDIADEMNLTGDKIREMIGFMVDRGLFDSVVFHEHSVLTSEGIQRRYQEAKKRLQRDINVNANFWVLENDETLSFIKIRGDSAESKNDSKSAKNPDKLAKNIIKESKGKESKVNKSKFTAPTVEEVREYCRERNNGIDAEHFVDHYTANGWLVGGKTPMKDWKAAVRTWERNDYNKGKIVPIKSQTWSGSPPSYDMDRAERKMNTTVPKLKKKG